MMSLLLSLALAASGTDTAANTQPRIRAPAFPRANAARRKEWNRQADTISHRQNNGQ